MTAMPYGNMGYAAGTGMSEGSIADAYNTITSQQSLTLQKAIPEDIQQVVKNWRSIIQDMQPSIRTVLKKARLSLGGENVLLIVFEDEFSESFVNTDAHKQEICDIIAKHIGKEVEVQIKRNETQGPFEESFVDIEKIINMDITIEEE